MASAAEQLADLTRNVERSRERERTGRQVFQLSRDLARSRARLAALQSLPEAVRHISLSGSVEPSENAEELYGLTKKRYAMLYPALKEAFHTRA